jgi:hypothetical protein
VEEAGAQFQLLPLASVEDGGDQVGDQLMLREERGDEGSPQRGVRSGGGCVLQESKQLCQAFAARGEREYAYDMGELAFVLPRLFQGGGMPVGQL